MKSKKHGWPTALIALVAVAAAIVASAGPAARGSAEDSDRQLCCVANPRFAGICAVELGPEETCQDVLDYLNNAASVGKTYCANTPVRMGWKQVRCEGEEAHGPC
jgi:hypothetical protein